MSRWAILALALLAPAVMAQDSEDEGRKLAAALTQGDVDTLGACQARVEGMGRLVDEFQGWMQQEGYTEQLDGIRRARDLGGDLIADFEELRALLGSEAGGFDLASSDSAREAMAAHFQRTPGETNVDAYGRWRAETKLPPACTEAMKRARWRVVFEQLDEDE